MICQGETEIKNPRGRRACLYSFTPVLDKAPPACYNGHRGTIRLNLYRRTMTNMKRLLSSLLALLLLASLAACGSNPSDFGDGAGQTAAGDSAVTPGDSAAGDDAAETEADVLAPYRSIDLGGRTVHISVSSNISENGGGMPSSYPYIAGPDELTGESVQDNVFERNHAVEEMLSVKLDYQPLDLNYDQV